MTAQAQETRRLIQACIEQGRRIEVAPPAPVHVSHQAKPKTFKTTPGPAQGVPYLSPYSPQKHRQRPIPISLKDQGLAVEGGRLRTRTKADDLMIVAPVNQADLMHRYQHERKGQHARYEARLKKGLCAKCPAPARLKKNGTRGVYCEKCAAKNKAYQCAVREKGTEAERVVRATQ